MQADNWPEDIESQTPPLMQLEVQYLPPYVPTLSSTFVSSSENSDRRDNHLPPASHYRTRIHEVPIRDRIHAR